MKIDQSDIQGPLIRYINTCLQGYPYLSHVLPANPDLHVNRATYDGVLLCMLLFYLRLNSYLIGTLVNYAHPGILDERVVNFIPDSDLEAKQNFVLYVFFNDPFVILINLIGLLIPQWLWDVLFLQLILISC